MSDEYTQIDLERQIPQEIENMDDAQLRRFLRRLLEAHRDAKSLSGKAVYDSNRTRGEVRDAITATREVITDEVGKATRGFADQEALITRITKGLDEKLVSYANEQFRKIEERIDTEIKARLENIDERIAKEVAAATEAIVEGQEERQSFKERMDRWEARFGGGD